MNDVIANNKLRTKKKEEEDPTNIEKLARTNLDIYFLATKNKNLGENFNNGKKSLQISIRLFWRRAGKAENAQSVRKSRPF